MKRVIPGCIICLILAVLASHAKAHHSYAIYDIVNPLSIRGEVVSYRYGNPHPILVVRETTENGEERTWTFEGPSTMMWKKLRLPKDIASEGEQITVTGWPARDGKTQMLLSAVVRESGEQIVLLREVRQREARIAAGLPAGPKGFDSRPPRKN